MFRRYPYWGWLVLSLALWCVNVFDSHIHKLKMTPSHMARVVNSDLRKKEHAFDELMQQEGIVAKLFGDSLSDAELNKVVNLPFMVYAYQNDSLKFWSSNKVIPAPCNDPDGKWTLLRNEKGVFMQKCLGSEIAGSTRQLVVLLPIVISYPLQNDFLKSQFVASPDLPVTATIEQSAKVEPGKYPVTMKNGSVAFYLNFKNAELQKWAPDSIFVLMLIAALMATISWVHLIIIHLTRNRSPLAGFLLTLGVIVVLRVLLYTYGLPFNLDALMFFSPLLYASSKYLSSFGDLFINTLCFLWLVIFTTRHTPYKLYFKRMQGKPVVWVVVPVLVFALVAYVFFFVSLVYSLVLDSNISFDLSYFYSINIYTILGLLVVGIITGLSCTVMYLVNAQLEVLVDNKWIRYALAAVIGAIYMFISGHSHELFWWLILAWVLLFLIILDFRNFSLVSDLFEPQMIFWAIFICVFCTSILQYFNDLKEQAARVAFVVQKLSPERDNEMEYAFDKAASKLENDALLKSFFKYPSLNGRKIITQRIDSVYFAGPVSKYHLAIYFYGEQGEPLYNKDTTGLATWDNRKSESLPTNSPNLFYKESILGDHYYLAYIPVYSDSINQRIGYVAVNMDKRRLAREAVYPELLQPTTPRSPSNSSDYAYAVYVNSKLISQNNDYPFTTYLPDDTLKEGVPQFITKELSELHYKVSEHRTVVVVHKNNEVLEIITLFSYIFVIQVALAFIIILYQLYLAYFTKSISSGKFFKLTLRKRVQFAMLSVVLVSFVIIGTVTVFFFVNQFKDSTSSKLQQAMETAKEAVQVDLKQVNAYDAVYIFDSFSRSMNFKKALTDLANEQRIDINIYDDAGYLFATSQDDIYEKGVISRMMRPDALYQLKEAGKSKVIQKENVGKLTYLSAYEPLRNEQGQTLGYINVPFFSSEKDLNSQISSIMVTLINLYAFIFLLSSIISVAITGWITKSFNLIIKQFGRLNLQKNERISWQYDDEIGLLVQEYNKMVNKVEENAALLAQSERETAWREMARQVAHEIKNPADADEAEHTVPAAGYASRSSEYQRSHAQGVGVDHRADRQPLVYRI
jgi:two-component system nitrogen regulation sensor histidine kinase NtrY